MSVANELTLNEVPEDAGITKAQLADLMGVSRKTITRMGYIATPDVIRAIENRKEVDTLREPELWEITHKNIALSRIKYGREGWPIDDVAKLFGLSVAQYNKEVDATVEFCLDKGVSFIELRGEG